MTKSGQEILERVKNNKEFTLSGNSGGYSQILYRNDVFIFVSGFGAVEEERREITPEEALRDVKQKLIMDQLYSKSGNPISTDEEALEYWNKKPFIG